MRALQVTRNGRPSEVLEVRDIDVCVSTWGHTLAVPAHPSNDQPALRLGLRMVKGLKEETALSIVTARSRCAFASAEDLANRAGLNDQTMRFLARAGALSPLSGHRHQAHWQVSGILNKLRR